MSEEFIEYDREKSEGGEMNYWVAAIWWVTGAFTFISSFWFPYDWHANFPEEGWFNIGIVAMFLFWCLTAIAVLKGFEWGATFSKKDR